MTLPTVSSSATCMPRALWLVALIATVLCCPMTLRAERAVINLNDAVVVSADQSPNPEPKAAQMLLEEVEKRTQVRWRHEHSWPTDSKTIIAIGTAGELERLATNRWHAPEKMPGAEGYDLRVDHQSGSTIVWVIGSDPRGVLYGVGKLLRSMSMRRQEITLPDGFSDGSAPVKHLRGHQLGYRPKTNSYDGWTVAMWEQYLRDLSVFGCNTIELIPPRSDDASDSPMFPLPQMQMMREMSRLADEYGMDVWIWYPAMDRNYADPKTVEHAIAEWGEVFKNLPRVDAVFVPGGDPGHTRPGVLFNLLEKQTENLRRYHPSAKMWMSPQSFTQEWFEEFRKLLDPPPAWLSGVVYGPEIRMSMHDFRKLIPASLPIRHYPDITHSLRCEYPVPDWDTAFAMTEAREPINPRPVGMANIFRVTSPDDIGFITYSEGCNDDVNKAVWSALGWNPDSDVTQILREYSRYFISPDVEDSFAQGLLGLERNWQGPVLSNDGIAQTLSQFLAMQRHATPAMKLNWRFQQALYRANYDAYVHDRLVYEASLEEQALSELRRAPQEGSLIAIDRAKATLDRAAAQPVSQDARSRTFEMAEALFQSIRMQLSVERYFAIAVGRGANLDEIDVPLNDRLWLESEFAAISTSKSEAARLEKIDGLLSRTNPGPGGFYDELGNPANRQHLIRGVGWKDDPGFYQTVATGFGSRTSGGQPLPRARWHGAEALYDAPVRMHYEHLDSNAHYRLRILFGSGDSTRVSLKINDRDVLRAGRTSRDMTEYEIPQQDTAKGTLDLAWYGAPGLGGNGRTFQIDEVWLMRN
ncbi:MAG TPA: glycoside hydrolase family 20 zincin-like fold domain-containing protein [Tepidisphaeraceae bacterium]|nr:glycoside hydrolase family 20 zincin-like fold domain-containing protein [Tepidisphaeraceae bacterium]